MSWIKRLWKISDEGVASDLNNIEGGIQENKEAAPYNALNYGAKIDGRRYKGITCTSAGAEVTVPGATFTSADVGKYGVCFEDFSNGTIRTISAVGSTSEKVVLSGAAGITITVSGYFAYGTDDLVAHEALFAAAKAEAASTPTVTFNQSKGGGRGVAVIPAENEGFSFIRGQLTVPSGVVLDCPAMLVNVLASRTEPAVVFSPYSSYREVNIEAMGGGGYKLGEAAGTQADIQGNVLRYWRVGEAGQEAVVLTGSGFLLDLIWGKGGTVGIMATSGSDCTINRAHVIGAAEPVKLVSTNQFKGFFILDSCGRTATEIGEGKVEVDGVAIDKECSDVNVEVQQFIASSAPARKLKAVISVGRNYVSGGNSINLCLKAQASLSGGALFFLSHCEDVEYTAEGSNKKTPSSPTPSAANEITFGAEYGAGAEGSIRGVGSGSSSIKPFTGSMAGTLEWMQKGVSYRYQSYGFAPTVAAGANAGASPPAPGKTECSDQDGFITFGTGTAPTAGAQVVVTFANGASGFGYTKTPKVLLTPRNAAAAKLGLYVSSESTTGFTVSSAEIPAISQANTTYAFSYKI